MPSVKYKVVRPRPGDLSDEKRQEIERYLLDHYQRAFDARAAQVDEDYDRWNKNYYGVPAQEVRVVPWTKASNLVVPIIRIFVDTLVARSLGIIHATRPFFVCDGFPTEVRDAMENYLDRKAIYEWQFWELTRNLLQRSAKDGTAIVKKTWEEVTSIDVMGAEAEGGDYSETLVVTYKGPCAKIIPFEDWAVYPITVEDINQATIKFHRIRMVEEEAKRQIAQGRWKDFTEDNLKTALKEPQDYKRQGDQEEMGVYDNWLKEVHLCECHFKWELQTGRFYDCIGVICPDANKMVDFYFNPFPLNTSAFTSCVPFPHENLAFGDSVCSMLEGFQEETSCIHNDRRNNSFIANAPVFKRRRNSLLPNPSTNWYPGKVWDLDDMNDFEVVDIGRNYTETLSEEQWNLTLAERLVGLGSLQQGMAEGITGKRGIYSATGTMAVLSESNARQDSYIHYMRQVLAQIGRDAFTLQRTFFQEDPTILFFPKEVQQRIIQGMQMVDNQALRRSVFEVNVADAAENSEVRRANLLQMSNIIGTYGKTVQEMIAQLVDPGLNPGIRAAMYQVLNMLKWMAAEILRAFGERNADEVLPDVIRIAQAAISGRPGAAQGPVQNAASGFLAEQTANPNGFGTALSGPSLASLANLSIPGSGGGA